MNLKLPVSGKAVALRSPGGAEEVWLYEAASGISALACGLLNEITCRTAGLDSVEWGALPVTDLEWTLLELRRAIFGDFVRTSSVCIHPDCGAKIDISFGIKDYLEQFQINMPKAVEKLPEPGWFSLAGNDIKFRVPTANDQFALTHLADPAFELQKLCVIPAQLEESLLLEVQEALAAMAPAISGLVRGACPECERLEDFYFDVQSYVVSEFLDQAKFVFEDVHLLAGQYHWSEEAILTMPRQRRFRYVEAILNDRSAL